MGILFLPFSLHLHELNRYLNHII